MIKEWLRSIKSDKGAEKLKAYLQPGEKFLINARTGLSEIEQDLPHFKPCTAQEMVDTFIRSGDFQSIRILPFAFMKNGERLSGYQAIVGIRLPKDVRP